MTTDAGLRPHHVTTRSTTESRGVQVSSASLLTTEELAQLLRVDPSTVRRWRTAHPVQGPPFIRLSDRVTLYRPEDVEQWLVSKRTMPQAA
jgi:hypothetical protein